jgi:hypothetical protein
MRKLLRPLLLGAVILAAASASNATVHNFRGTLQLQLGQLPPVVATGGAAATLNSSAGLGPLTTLGLNGGITGTGKVFITDPNAAPLLELRGTMTLGAGALAPIVGGGPLTQNTLPVQGVFKMCIIFGGCISYIPIPLTAGGTRGVGLGGLLTVNGYGAGIQISVIGAPWTIATAVITGIPTANGGFSTSTAQGWAHGPASGTSSTANHGGVVQLVTPTITMTTLGTGTLTPLFGILTIHFVPEPGTFLLFGSGVVGLAVFGRRRRTR